MGLKCSMFFRDNGNVLIVGRSGSGKTSYIQQNYIKDIMRSRTNFIIFDIKGEYRSCTSEFFLKKGYEIQVISPFDLSLPFSTAKLAELPKKSVVFITDDNISDCTGNAGIAYARAFEHISRMCFTHSTCIILEDLSYYLDYIDVFCNALSVAAQKKSTYIMTAQYYKQLKNIDMIIENTSTNIYLAYTDRVNAHSDIKYIKTLFSKQVERFEHNQKYLNKNKVNFVRMEFHTLKDICLYPIYIFKSKYIKEE